jgi:hypothetical protein
MRAERLDRFQSASTWVLRGFAAIAVAFMLPLIALGRVPPKALTSPESPTFNGATFIQELRRLKAELDTARKSPETLRSYREALPEAWSVEADGRRYEVPSSAVVSRLRKAEADPQVRRQQIEQARDYLDALAAETASLSGQSSPPTDSARTKLDAILAQPEFKRGHKETWWDRLRARIDEAIYSALARIFRRVGGQTELGTILLWVGICAAAVLIAYWIFGRWFRAARMEEMALQSSLATARSWQEWVFAAREAASRGDYRAAIQCAYWAGIARLQELGALSADRSKTPREFLRALTKSKLLVAETHSSRYQALSLLTSRLEKTWYGYQIATETDFRDSLSQLENLGCHLH